MKFQKYFDTDKNTRIRMSHVPSKRGPDENIIAYKLWHKGIRYRRNYKKLPGSPDIAITKYKIAIFIDGEFWHGYDWNESKKHLKRNRDYWIKKIEYNMERDKHNDSLLINNGWYVLHFWSKMALNHPDYCIDLIMYFIKNRKDDSF